jgi:uncharacterized protein
MQIGIFGGRGVIGSAIANEALDRGHDVTAFTRQAGRMAGSTDHERLRWQTADPTDVESVASALSGLDVAVNAINSGEDVASAIEHAEAIPAAARALVSGMHRHPAVRLIAIGGGGSLEVSPGLQLADTPGFAESLPERLGVPSAYVKVVEAQRRALAHYRSSNRLWTYISPSSWLVQPGTRTARFRVGRDTMLTDAAGHSAISAEDLAVAVIDEAEHPRHVQLRFTVGY